MKYLTFMYIVGMIMYAPLVLAQVFDTEKSMSFSEQKEQMSEKAVINTDNKSVTNTDDKNIVARPTTMTPEEKAQVKMPLVKEIIKDIDKTSKKERQEIINVIKNLQRTTIRRQNLNLPEEQQIDENEDIAVNVSSKDDVRDYMLNKLVAPIDSSMNIR